MKISIAIMAHPSREKFFPYLREKLGDIPFSIDETGIGVWESRKRATLMFDPTADYHLVLQDDAIICENFKELAEKTIGNNGKYVYNFYYGRRRNRVKEAKHGEKKGYVISDKVTWGVAICFPTKLIPEMIKYCDKLTAPQDDHRIGLFVRHKGIKVYFPIPSLIEHRAEEESLVGNAFSPGRKAAYFIDNKTK